MQCDKSSAKRLNSAYLPKDWSSYGVLVAHFVSSLVVSAWTASGDFTLRESVANALQAYYLLLIQTMAAMEKYGKKWSRFWLPSQTVRNLCDLAGHFVISARFWPSDLPWRPKARQEAAIEQYFGRVKSHTRGSPTAKDGVFGMQMTHARLLNEAHSLQDINYGGVAAVTESELQTIAEKALDWACTFQAGSKKDAKSKIQQVILYHIISYYIILYHIISHYLILYHIISYYIILYHIISYYREGVKKTDASKNLTQQYNTRQLEYNMIPDDTIL